MLRSRGNTWRLLAVVLITLATVSFHYGFLLTPSQQHGGFLHAIHGRLCYIPIILAAIWFGVRGGVATALGITLLTLPYPRIKGITDRNVLLGEYTEMVFYLAIGLVAGILIEQQWRERRKREAMVEELAVKERLSSLGQMAAGLAHEIKNPLGSIQGAAEILFDDPPADTRKRDLFEVLKKETKRLNGVVEHFLRFARPHRPVRARTQLNALLEQVISQVELEDRASDIEFVRNLSGAVPDADVDAEQIHQVFLNILQNAVSAPGTKRVEVTTSRQGGGVAATVRDDGEGIAPEHLARVFDPFFTTRDNGTGLGLSISHQIVRENGGRITIDSEQGRGTTVTVMLPAFGGDTK
jgi:two-component system sensor histidine kinase HydH